MYSYIYDGGKHNGIGRLIQTIGGRVTETASRGTRVIEINVYISHIPLLQKRLLAGGGDVTGPNKMKILMTIVFNAKIMFKN